MAVLSVTTLGDTWALVVDAPPVGVVAPEGSIARLFGSTPGRLWLNVDGAATWVPLVAGPATSTDDALAVWDGATGSVVQDSVILASPTGLTLPKAAGSGFKVDAAAATYPWRDILGAFHARAAGAAAPAWQTFRGTIRAYEWSNSGVEQEMWIEYHMPHDWVPGTDLFLHIHWMQNVVDTGGPAGVPGTVEWRFDVSYAKGHGTPGGAADPFNAAVTMTLNQQAPTTQYGHMIAEGQITNAGGDASHLDVGRIEVDGIMLVRVYRDADWAGDTLNQVPFASFADLHYQSTGMGTKQKAPNFYV